MQQWNTVISLHLHKYTLFCQKWNYFKLTRWCRSSLLQPPIGVNLLVISAKFRDRAIHRVLSTESKLYKTHLEVAVASLWFQGLFFSRSFAYQQRAGVMMLGCHPRTSHCAKYLWWTWSKVKRLPQTYYHERSSYRHPMSSSWSRPHFPFSGKAVGSRGRGRGGQAMAFTPASILRPSNLFNPATPQTEHHDDRQSTRQQPHQQSPLYLTIR